MPRFHGFPGRLVEGRGLDGGESIPNRLQSLTYVSVFARQRSSGRLKSFKANPVTRRQHASQ